MHVSRSALRLLLAIFLLAGHVGSVAAAANPGIVVVAHSGVATDALALGSVRAVFSMRVKTWPDGTPVRVFVLPDRSDEHITFSKNVLNIYPYVLRDTWDKMVFTGTGQAPVEVKDEAALLRSVASTPGAIGYALNPKGSNAKLKILEIR